MFLVLSQSSFLIEVQVQTQRSQLVVTLFQFQQNFPEIWWTKNNQSKFTINNKDDQQRHWHTNSELPANIAWLIQCRIVGRSFLGGLPAFPWHELFNSSQSSTSTEYTPSLLQPSSNEAHCGITSVPPGAIIITPNSTNSTQTINTTCAQNTTSEPKKQLITSMHACTYIHNKRTAVYGFLNAKTNNAQGWIILSTWWWPCILQENRGTHMPKGNQNR